MRVTNGCVVALQYTLRNDEGVVIEEVSSDEPFYYLHGHSNILPQLEAEIDSLESGAQFDVELGPEDAYGLVNPRFQQRVERAEFPEGMEIKPGMAFELVAETDEERQMLGHPEEAMVFYVKEVDDFHVVIDANHPLAGMTLRFEGEVVEVRAATEDELDHGHAHYPGMADH